MKDKTTKTTLADRPKGQADFQHLRQMRDAEIDFSDIPKLDESFWKNAELVMPAARAGSPSGWITIWSNG